MLRSFLFVCLLASAVAGFTADAIAFEKQPDLSERFLAHLAQIDKKKTSGKKLYAACLFHAGKGLESMTYIEKELRGGEDDLPLLLGYYRLAERLDKKKASATVPKLVGKVVVKPFEAIVALQLAKFHLRESREEYLASLRLAIDYNPLDPAPYFSCARGSKEIEEQMHYCACALLLTDRETELSAKIIDFLEKSQSK